LHKIARLIKFTKLLGASRSAGIRTEKKKEKCLSDFREDKMRIVAGFVALILLLSFCAVFGQNWSQYYDGMSKLSFVDFNSSGFGARSRAMGGVYMATSNEAYGSFENPATMTTVNKAMMSIELVNYQDKHQGLAEPRLLNSQGSGFYIGKTDYKNQRTKIINQAGAVALFTYAGREWWIGGGYRTANDFSLKFETPVNINNPDSYVRDKDLSAINLALATRPLDYISVGVNMNLYTRRYEENFLGRQIPVFDTSSTAYDFHYHDKSNFTGANFDFGLMAEYNIFSFGAVVRTPYTLRQNVFRLLTNLDQYGQDATGFLDRIKVKYQIPLSYAIGISVKPIENLIIAGDFDNKPYSNTKKSLDFESSDLIDFSDVNANWNDLAQFRVGAEYVFNGGFAQIPVRAGIHNMPNVQFASKVVANSVSADSSGPYYHYTYDYSDEVKPMIISFGSGLKFERTWFDLAYEFGSKEYNQTMQSPIETVTDKIKFNYSRLYLSVGMLF
jgi:hypothetical protein